MSHNGYKIGLLQQNLQLDSLRNRISDRLTLPKPENGRCNLWFITTNDDTRRQLKPTGIGVVDNPNYYFIVCGLWVSKSLKLHEVQITWNKIAIFLRIIMNRLELTFYNMVQN